MRQSMLFVAAGCLTLAAASAHNHITVDTVSGTPGDQILIRAGYLPAEAAFTIVDGRLMLDGKIAVYDVAAHLGQDGAYHDWFAGDELLLTTDFFFATGRLDGGNFQWELASVAPIESGGATMAWGVFGAGGVFQPRALSDAPERPDRSYQTPPGAHEHAQGYAFSGPGLYDVTFIVWDSNAVYLDSAPLTVRFQVGETCVADFDGDGVVNSQDFFAYLTAFFAEDHEADLNHDEAVNSQDFFDFLAAFFAGC